MTRDTGDRTLDDRTLGNVEGRIDQVNRRVDLVRGEMATGFQQVRGEMTAGFDRVNGRIDGLILAMVVINGGVAAGLVVMIMLLILQRG